MDNEIFKVLEQYANDLDKLDDMHTRDIYKLHSYTDILIFVKTFVADKNLSDEDKAIYIRFINSLSSAYTRYAESINRKAINYISFLNKVEEESKNVDLSTKPSYVNALVSIYKPFEEKILASETISETEKLDLLKDSAKSCLNDEKYFGFTGHISDAYKVSTANKIDSFTSLNGLTSYINNIINRGKNLKK